MIVSEIGIDTIMDKCPHFKNWIDRISESVLDKNI